MSIDKLIETISKLSALETRTRDVMNHVVRVEKKLDNLIERISRLETQYEGLKENIKNSILADLKADIVRTQYMIENSTAKSKSIEIKAVGEKKLPPKSSSAKSK